MRRLIFAGLLLAGCTSRTDMLATAQQATVRVQAKDGYGSGVVISPHGLVLTCEHVTRGSTTVKIMLADGRTMRGKVFAADAARDVALVVLSTETPNFAALGPAPYVGADLYVIGTPGAGGGKLFNSVVHGIVSGRHRTVGPWSDRMQTDAMINPGDSGGPVFDADGQVVGLAEGIACVDPLCETAGISFVVPVRAIRSFLAVFDGIEF